MVLLTNAPPSRYVGLEAFGLRIVGQRRIELSAWPAGQRSAEAASSGTRGSQGAHILIIEAPYYEAISDELAAGAIAELEPRGPPTSASWCRARWKFRWRWPRR